MLDQLMAVLLVLALLAAATGGLGWIKRLLQRATTGASRQPRNLRVTARLPLTPQHCLHQVESSGGEIYLLATHTAGVTLLGTAGTGGVDRSGGADSVASPQNAASAAAAAAGGHGPSSRYPGSHSPGSHYIAGHYDAGHYDAGHSAVRHGPSSHSPSGHYPASDETGRRSPASDVMGNNDPSSPGENPGQTAQRPSTTARFGERLAATAAAPSGSQSGRAPADRSTATWRATP